MLAVETDHDVSILDLEHVTASPPAAPIVVATLDGGTPETATPVELLYDDGDPTRDDDARLVIRFAGSSKVAVLTFAPPSPTSSETTGMRGFEVVRGEVVADGIVAQVELVGTTDGPRLALLVPSANAIELVELNARSETGRVSLSHPYQSWANLRRDGVSDTFVLTNAVWTVADNSAAGIRSPNPTEDAPYGHVETVRSLLEVGFVLQVPSPHDDLVLFRAGVSRAIQRSSSSTSRRARSLAWKRSVPRFPWYRAMAAISGSSRRQPMPMGCFVGSRRR